MSKLSKVGLVMVVVLAATTLWAAKVKPKSSFQISSKSFTDGGQIPDQFSCKGANTSPDVMWKGAPPKTKTFALIVEDPDAPSQTWTHWIIYNIPVKKAGPDQNTYELTEGYPRDEETAGGILQGSNDYKKTGYDGPCPSTGLHRYYFVLYALNSVLTVPAGVSRDEMAAALKSHILAKTQMMGLYGK